MNRLGIRELTSGYGRKGILGSGRKGLRLFYVATRSTTTAGSMGTHGAYCTSQERIISELSQGDRYHCVQRHLLIVQYAVC